MKLGRSEYGLMESLGWDRAKSKNLMVGGVLVVILIAQLVFALIYRNGPTRKPTPPSARARVEGVVITAAPLLPPPAPAPTPARVSTIAADTAAPTTTEVELDYFKPTATVDLFSSGSATSTGSAEPTVAVESSSAADVVTSTAPTATSIAPTAPNNPVVFGADSVPTSVTATAGTRAARKNSESGVAPTSAPVSVNPAFVEVPVISELPTSILATISVTTVPSQRKVA